MNPPNGSWVELDSATIQRNARAIQASLSPSTCMIAVVKSDAYGHGLADYARTLRQAGVKHFALAYAFEAAVVREAVPDAELLLVLGGAAEDDVPMMLEKQITPMVVSLEAARRFAEAAVHAGGTLSVHLKLDTGMGRLGFRMPAELADASAAACLPGLFVAGVGTHFPMVEPERYGRMLCGQMDGFREAVEALERLLGRRLFRHASSSRAALLLPEYDWDAVRVGIALYGYGGSAEGGRFHTRPVLQWKARLVQVRDVPAGFPVGYYSAYRTTAPTRLGVVSCGYADGYNRLLGNVNTGDEPQKTRGVVLVHGKRCPVAGRVSMNWISVDLGADSPARPGDEVVLLGEQGGEAVWADELAKHCKTIPYEILTGISRTLERRMVE